MYHTGIPHIKSQWRSLKLQHPEVLPSFEPMTYFLLDNISYGGGGGKKSFDPTLIKENSLKVVSQLQTYYFNRYGNQAIQSFRLYFLV